MLSSPLPGEIVQLLKYYQLATYGEQKTGRARLPPSLSDRKVGVRRRPIIRASGGRRAEARLGSAGASPSRL
jgi:hypothetical protein